MSNALLFELRALQTNGISKSIKERYNEFKSFAGKSEEDWFSELCFCLTTANSSAMMGLKVQDALGFDGFYNLPQKKLTRELKSLGYRFYNKRAEYIVGARRHFGIKEKLQEFENDREKRNYLFENVKGYGLKESSHFLRNTGHDNCAILDRHIIRLMHEHALISALPKTITERNYLQIESALDNFAQKAKMNHSLLDLYLWYMKTGKVLK
ncbi:MAG TPA: N-glycosylase/DNA lyase [archaeon]|nr:N-glycosylase/DNA lyase [archaeon]